MESGSDIAFSYENKYSVCFFTATRLDRYHQMHQALCAPKRPCGANPIAPRCKVLRLRATLMMFTAPHLNDRGSMSPAPIEVSKSKSESKSLRIVPLRLHLPDSASKKLNRQLTKLTLAHVWSDFGPQS